MKAKWEKTEANVGVLEIEVESSQVASALDQAFKKVVRQVNLPGFRKGKVPRKLFESRYGIESLYQDALEILVPNAYTEAVRDTQIEPVAQPDVDIVQIEAGKSLIFKATVTVKPEVKLGEYKGVAVPAKDFSVTDEEVDAELADLQRSHAEIYVVEDEEGVVEGDTVTMDFRGTVDGEPFEGGEAEEYQLEVGSNTFIAGFEEQLIGMKKGEERDISVTFPEEYHAKRLAGKDAVFHIVMREVRRKRLPELDDEFAKDVSEFETLEALRADIRAKLEASVETRQKRYVEETALQAVVDGTAVDIPDVMIENEMNLQLEDYKNRLRMQGIPFDTYLEFSGSSEDEIREQFRESAQIRVRRDLVIDAIAAAEQVDVSEDDVNEELARIAADANTDVDRVRRVLSLRDPNLIDLHTELRARKVVQLIAEHSKVA